MIKRRLAFALVVGLLVAMFASACGVAFGPVQFTTGGPAILSPAITGLHLPDLQQTATLSSMHEMQGWRHIQQQVVSEFGVGHCHGGD